MRFKGAHSSSPLDDATGDGVGLPELCAWGMDTEVPTAVAMDAVPTPGL